MIMKTKVWGTDGCPKCKQLEANLQQMGQEVEHGDAASADGFIYLSKKKCRPTKVPILEVEGQLFKYDQLFTEQGSLRLETLQKILSGQELN